MARRTNVVYGALIGSGIARRPVWAVDCQFDCPPEATKNLEQHLHSDPGLDY
jgi:hypothetical protein